MIVATRSDKNDEELAINTVVGSDKYYKNDEALPDAHSARVDNSTGDEAISPACTMCAKCETHYEKMYAMPETNSTTKCSLFVLRFRMYKVCTLYS
jgi:hypothetical protein